MGFYKRYVNPLILGSKPVILNFFFIAAHKEKDNNIIIYLKFGDTLLEFCESLL